MIEICWADSCNRVRYQSKQDCLLVHYVEGLIKEGSSLANCELSGYNFAYADFRYGNFREANMRGCVLAGADLRGADFRGADRRECVLTGGLMDGAKRQEARWDGAVVDVGVTLGARL